MRNQRIISRPGPFVLVTACLFWLAILFSVSQFLLINSAQANCVACSRAQSFEQLCQKAAEKGKANVIVKLQVDRLEGLTAASNAHRAITPGRSFPKAGRDADMALKTAITGVAEGVIKALAGTAFSVRSRFSTLPLVAMRVSVQSLMVLENLPQVVACVPDEPVKLVLPVEESAKKGRTVDNKKKIGPLSLAKPSLNDTTGIIGADTAWGMGYTGAGWYVAVLDTGILNTHEFFSGKDIVEKCFSANDDCPNGLSEDEGRGAAKHYPLTYEGFDHGTHVTGIATGNNGTLFGVAKDADIIAVQVFSEFSAADCGGVSPCIMSWTSDELKGLEYVYQLRSSYSIASVNMSLGGGAYSSSCDGSDLKTAIDNLRAVGIATVIATGNDGYCGAVSAPACISSSISVGASDDNDIEAYFNNWHPVLQRFFAPGVNVYSSTGDSSTDDPNTSYASWNGTSMATPHVSGAWAILRQAAPLASVTDIYDALRSTGTPITTLCPSGGSVPRINIDRAIYCDSSVLLIDATLPEPSADVVPGIQATLNARVSEQCGGLVDGVTVEATFSNGDSPVQMFDDGLHDDGAAGDGLYGNGWTPVNEQDPTTITYTASKTGFTTATDQVDVSVGYFYCSAGASDSSYEYISNVTFAGINNDSAGGSGYSDYTSGVKAVVTPGTDETLSVTISPDSNESLSVFIDWNQNLVFDDPGERYDLASGTDLPGPFTTTITVPTDASLGDTRMRVVLEWYGTPGACSLFDDGEVEDYTVSIACDPSVLLAEAVSPEPSAQAVVGNQTTLLVNVTDQCGDPASGVTVEATFSNGDSPVQMFDDGLHDDGAADDGLYGNGWIPANAQDPTTITYTASKTGFTSGTDQVDVAILSDYCDAGGLDATGEYITNVTFAGINNDSAGGSGYSDYTSGVNGVVSPTTAVSLSVTISPDADDYLSVFIDWNQNLVFDDPDERYDLAGGTDQTGPFTTQISVPADAGFGDTRLRVVLAQGAIPGPCGQFDSGEVEDYTVNVVCDPSILQVEATAPAPSTSLVPGNQVLLLGRVSDQCGGLTDSVTVECAFSNGDSPVQLFDDGVHGDGADNDGLYGNWWAPVNQQDPTTITWTASKAGFTSGTDQVDVAVVPGYCDAGADDASGEYITNVTFAGINNDSTGPGGYSDFTLGTAASVTIGTDEDLSVTINPLELEHLAVFIDWNGNSYFDDPEERYDLVSGTDQPGPFTTLVSVPADAAPGRTRMRVVLISNDIPEPCGQFAYGEVEDYMVNVFATDASLDLVQGWNLISLPISPAETGIATVLDSIAGKYISVWSFSGGSWKLYDPANPGFSDLTDMDAGIGYWINMAEAATLTITGTAPANTIPIASGWNMVGYNASASQAVADSLSSIDGKYLSVWAYPNGAWKLYDPANPGFSDLLTMDPGYGYWINANTDCTWSM